MQKILLKFKNIDKKILKIMKYGWIFSLLVCLIASSILFSYIFSGINLFYHIGLLMMKSGFYFIVEFIACGLIVDSIRKNAI